jgi:hypothetical protein
MAVEICHADQVATSIRKNWHYLRRQAAVAQSVQFDRGLRPRSLVFFSFVSGILLGARKTICLPSTLHKKINSSNIQKMGQCILVAKNSMDAILEYSSLYDVEERRI